MDMLKSRSKMSMMLMLLATLLFVLGACSTNKVNTESKESTQSTETTENTDDSVTSNINNESDSGEVPEGLKEAESPTYEVGSHAYIEADHMEGMQGAKAMIVGAYDTTAYEISYTPTNGGEKVENYKWVIQEELQDAGAVPLEPGTKVTVNAAHAEGMKGATAEIVSSEQTTVYMVDFTTTDGQDVKNHKWVTESELLPVK